MGICWEKNFSKKFQQKKLMVGPCMGSQMVIAGSVCSFSPYEPGLVAYVILLDLRDYAPGPSTPDNSLEGSSR